MTTTSPLQRAQKILAREQIGAHGRNGRTSSTTPSYDEPFTQDSVQFAGQQRGAVVVVKLEQDVVPHHRSRQTRAGRRVSVYLDLHPQRFIPMRRKGKFKG